MIQFGYRVWRVAVVRRLAALVGCTVGLRYARPTAPTPPAYKEIPPNWKVAQPSDQVLRGEWWGVKSLVGV